MPDRTEELAVMAMAALVGIGTWKPGYLSGNATPEEVCEERAKWAFLQAQAMLNELDKTRGE